MKGKIFNAQEVQSILNGSKVMFRVVVNTKQSFIEPNQPYGKLPFEVGETIFVKEKFAYIQDPNECAKENEPCEIHYKADYDAEGLDKYDIEAIGIEFLSALRMPEWASRLTLRIKSVKVERLQDISEEDCWKEGLEEFADYQDQVKVCQMAKQLGECIEDPRPHFATWWNSTHKKPEEKLEANPWIFAYEYEVVR